MGSRTLAKKIGQPVIFANDLLRLHREMYPKFWEWSDGALDYAMFYGKLWTTFGWTIRIGTNPNPNTLRNFPMQANGAEMLRLACCYAVEGGIRVCAPVHDALLIEACLDDLDNMVVATQAAMSDASAAVLSGFRLRSEVKIVRYPDRYMDERGAVMWETVQNLLDGPKDSEPVHQ